MLFFLPLVLILQFLNVAIQLPCQDYLAGDVIFENFMLLQ